MNVGAADAGHFRPDQRGPRLNVIWHRPGLESERLFKHLQNRGFSLLHTTLCCGWFAPDSMAKTPPKLSSYLSQMAIVLRMGLGGGSGRLFSFFFFFFF